MNSTSLLAGEYSSGGFNDSQSYATKVFGGPEQQHSVGTLAGGNQDNTIATTAVKNCQAGGKRNSRRNSRRNTRRNSRRNSRKGGDMNKKDMKRMVTKIMKEKGGNILKKAMKTGKDFKDAVSGSVQDALEKTKVVSEAIQQSLRKKGGKVRKTLKTIIKKEMKK
jgi:hypothetical protein